MKTEQTMCEGLGTEALETDQPRLALDRGLRGSPERPASEAGTSAQRQEAWIRVLGLSQTQCFISTWHSSLICLLGRWTLILPTSHRFGVRIMRSHLAGGISEILNSLCILLSCPQFEQVTRFQIASFNDIR